MARCTMMFVVVPGKEIGRVGARVLDGSEARREVWPVLHRLEMGFRERVIVRDFGARVRFDDTEVGEQKSNGLRRHRRSAIGVDRELIWSHALPATAVGQKTLREYSELAVREHPTDDVSTEDIHHDVKVKIGP